MGKNDQNKITDFESLLRKVLENNTDSFTWQLPDETMFFMQTWMGNAKYVYHIRAAGENLVLPMLTKTPHICMISAGGMLYTLNIFTSLLKQKDQMEELSDLPEDLMEKVTDLGDYKNEVNRKIWEDGMRYVDTLVLSKPDESDWNYQSDLKWVARLARGVIILREDVEAVIKRHFYHGIPSMKVQDIAESLCGVRDLMTDAKKAFSRLDEEFRMDKVLVMKLREYVNSPLGILSGEEFRISECLNNSNEDLMDVLFCYEGKEAQAKVIRERLLELIYERDVFSPDYFQTAQAGRKVMETLGCTDKNPLTICNIAEIRCKGKTLYRKEVA